MKIGLDIHGVIDENPDFFKAVCAAMIKDGHEIHIITGPSLSKVGYELLAMGFEPMKHYTSIFSIVDYHIEIGTEITYDKQGHAWMDKYLWDRTKGDYCLREKIDMHLDDSDAYAYFFKTPFARFFSKNKRTHYVKGDAK